MIKNYLMDTSTLLENPQNIYGFEDNNVIICGTTLQELDSKKKVPGLVGYNARECCRILDELRESGDLIHGVALPNGGKLYVEPNGIQESLLPKGYKIEVPDNRIISTCLWLKQNGKDPILLTNDVSMRVNATICGVKVQKIKNDIQDTSYTGHMDLDVESEVINKIYKNGSIAWEDVHRDDVQPLCNQFITLHCDKQSALSVFREGELINIKEKQLFGGIRPLNKMQTYAIWALTQPVDKIPLVILKGEPGTAKTFLSLAAGLSQVYLGQGRRSDDEYNHILISRPNTQTSDPGFGYLPGELDEKMAPLIASYRDNLEEIVRNKEKGEDREQIEVQIDDWFETGTIELCPLNFIRGRSLHNSYIICDEAQNANKLLIRDVITRAGHGSKIIVAGDPTQCDVPTLDKKNNGLVFAADKMKGNSLCAIISFPSENCVRSPLAETASKLLTL